MLGSMLDSMLGMLDASADFRDNNGNILLSQWYERDVKV